MAPKKLLKTPSHSPNRKGGKKVGKELELHSKVKRVGVPPSPRSATKGTTKEAAVCIIPKNKSSGKLIKPKNANSANFKDPVKESLGKEPLGNLSAVKSLPTTSGAPSGSGAGGSCPVGPSTNTPFSPRDDPNNKGVQAPAPACSPDNEASICALRKREQQKKMILMGIGGFLFLLLFWWMFKSSIYKFLGIGDGSGSGGIGADGFGGAGGIEGVGGRGGKGGRGDGFGDGDDDDDGDGLGGGRGGRSRGLGKFKGKGRMCWFNLPCTLDTEGG